MITASELYAEFNFELVPFIWKGIKEKIKPEVKAEIPKLLDKPKLTGDLLLKKFQELNDLPRSESSVMCGYDNLGDFYEAVLSAKKAPKEQEPTILSTSRNVFEVEPTTIRFDAKRFQFKRLSGKDGNVGSLTGVKLFDNNLAGVLLCWKDPKDDLIYVVNGHNRLILARSLKVSAIAVKLIKAETATEARFIGGLANIAEKSCDVYDVAKFLRDNSLSDKELADRGICLKGVIVKDSLAIIKLNDLLFSKFLSGELPPEIAIAIGEAELSESQQNTIWDSVKQLLESGKDLTKNIVKDFIDSVKVVSEYFHADIFGNISSTSCAYEYAKLVNQIVRTMSKNVKVFGVAAKNSDLLKEGNNTIDRDASSSISQKNQAILNWFKRESKFVGAVAQYLNQQALKLAKNQPVIIDQIIQSLYDMYKRSPAVMA